MQASRRANLLYTPLIALPKRILPYKTHRICANHTSAVGWGSGVRPLESQLRHSAAADFFSPKKAADIPSLAISISMVRRRLYAGCHDYTRRICRLAHLLVFLYSLEQ